MQSPAFSRVAYIEELGGPRNTVSATMTIAFLIMAKWPQRTPRIEELRSEYGMSRATAYRWRRALTDARGM